MFTDAFPAGKRHIFANDDSHNTDIVIFSIFALLLKSSVIFLPDGDDRNVLRLCERNEAIQRTRMDCFTPREDGGDGQAACIVMFPLRSAESSIIKK
jgi:hypothetical protein